MRAKLFALLCGFMLAASSGWAQPSLQFVLNPAAQSGAGSNAVFFVGTLINPSVSSNLFLNDIQFTPFGIATNYLSSGANTFFANVPGLLRPGETYYNDVVFSVGINPSTPPGDYFAAVAIQGGEDIFAGSNLASQTILITSTDTLGDGIPDWWRQQYFGSGTTTNAQSCATCDADTTGQNNLFKYVAGLVPTNPASVFALGISNAPDLPPQPALSFGPAVAGRSYTWQFSTNSPAGPWSPLVGAIGPQTNGSQITVTDGSAVEAQRFYRVQIALP